MKTRLLHLIFCACAFHLVEVQSRCDFIHTDGTEIVYDDKKCLCGPEKIPEYNETTEGPNSNSPNMRIIHYSQCTSSISIPINARLANCNYTRASICVNNVPTPL